MSKIKVNIITNKNEDGPVELSYGATVPSGKTFEVLTGSSFSGIVTATSFVGDGSNLTGLGGSPSTVSKLFAIRLILDPTVYRS
jgi:hypothetical protein